MKPLPVPIHQPAPPPPTTHHTLSKQTSPSLFPPACYLPHPPPSFTSPPLTPRPHPSYLPTTSHIQIQIQIQIQIRKHISPPSTNLPPPSSLLPPIKTPNLPTLRLANSPPLPTQPSQLNPSHTSTDLLTYYSLNPPSPLLSSPLFLSQLRHVLALPSIQASASQ